MQVVLPTGQNGQGCNVHLNKRVWGLGFPVTLTAVVAGVLLLSGCGDKKEGKAASQVAARVNESDITVHQINFRLQSERGLKPEQMEPASRRVLDQLIEQELTIQKAMEQKLDQDPRVVQQLEGARRDVLARAYLQQIAATVQPPAPDVVRKYYDEHPELFSQRRIYQIREYVAPEVSAAQLAELSTAVAAAKAPVEFENWARGKQLAFESNVAVRPAERVPMSLLARLAPVQNGRGIVVAEAPQARVMFVLDSRTQPVSFEQTEKAIRDFLHSEARRKAVEANVAALRTAAKISYEGKFAGQAASAPALSTTRNANLESGLPASGVQINLPGTEAASGAQVSLPTSTASGVSVSLPTAGSASGVAVSLPGVGASGVEVRLPGSVASAVKP